MNFARIKTSIAGIAILGALVTTVPMATAANAAVKPDVTRFTLFQPKHIVFPYENLPGEIPGKKLYYVSQLTKPSGEDFGILTGSISTVEPLQGTNPEETQLQLLHFTLPGGLIVAQSYNVYPRGAVEIDPNKPLVSAITGGTGKYIGARGQIIHTRNTDGTYTHKFALLK